MTKQPDHGDATIIHVMADGSVRDSVEGYLTSVDQLSDLTQELIRKILTLKPGKSA